MNDNYKSEQEFLIAMAEGVLLKTYNKRPKKRGAFMSLRSLLNTGETWQKLSVSRDCISG